MYLHILTVQRYTFLTQRLVHFGKKCQFTKNMAFIRHFIGIRTPLKKLRQDEMPCPGGCLLPYNGLTEKSP